MNEYRLSLKRLDDDDKVEGETILGYTTYSDTAAIVHATDEAESLSELYRKARRPYHVKWVLTKFVKGQCTLKKIADGRL